MIKENSKIFCSFIDWDMYESMKALEDQEFQKFLHSILKLPKTKPPQYKITTPQSPLSYLLSKEINEEFISYPTWETFWEEFKNAQNERDEKKRRTD